MGCSSSKDQQGNQVQNEPTDANSLTSHHNPEFEADDHESVGGSERDESEVEQQVEFQVVVTGGDTGERQVDTEQDSDIVEEEWRKYIYDQKQKLLLDQLRVATAARDKYALEKTLAECCNRDLGNHKEVIKGQKIMERLIARDDLRSAVHGRNIEEIEAELENIKKRGFARELQQDMIEAHFAIEMIRREQLNQDNVLALDKKTMSEIRRYQSPPAMMHRVIQAALLLLGEDEYTTQDWLACQKLMNPQGNVGLSRKFHNFSVNNVHPEICARSKYILLEEMFDIRTGKPVEVVNSSQKNNSNKKIRPDVELSEADKKKYWRTYDMATIQKVSPAAAPFYVWSMGAIDDFEQSYGGDFAYVEPASKDRQVEIFEEYEAYRKTHPRHTSQKTGKYMSKVQASDQNSARNTTGSSDQNSARNTTGSSDHTDFDREN